MADPTRDGIERQSGVRIIRSFVTRPSLGEKLLAVGTPGIHNSKQGGPPIGNRGTMLKPPHFRKQKNQLPQAVEEESRVWGARSEVTSERGRVQTKRALGPRKESRGNFERRRRDLGLADNLLESGRLRGKWGTLCIDGEVRVERVPGN